MASIRNLKKDIHYVIGDIIDFALFKGGDAKKTEAIIDEAITDFDLLIARVHQKDIDNKRLHFKSIRNDLETKAKSLLEKVNSL